MYFLVQNNHTVLPTYLKYIGTFYIQNMSHTIYKLYLYSNRLWYLPLGASICLSGSISISKHDSFDIVTSCLLFTKRFFLQFQHLQKFLWHCMMYTIILYTNNQYIYKTFCLLQVNFRMCTLHLPHLMYVVLL